MTADSTEQDVTSVLTSRTNLTAFFHSTDSTDDTEHNSAQSVEPGPGAMAVCFLACKLNCV